ncbi:MAG: GntR family transcriptional regulator [Myxococcota bacterium]|nr:GntR family transcriptional regulator [Myxococcota bacterium]
MYGGYDFTKETRVALNAARDCAAELRDGYVGTEHLLLGLLRTSPTCFPGDEAVSELENRVKSKLGPKDKGSKASYSIDLAYTSIAKEALKAAIADGRGSKAGVVAPQHLLKALVADKGIAGIVLRESGFQWDWSQREVESKDSPADVMDIVKLDDECEEPYYEQIRDRIKEAIATGALGPGERLPSVRTLADSLNLAPGTVARAYAMLEEEGVVETAGPKGTRVAYSKRDKGMSPEERVAELSELLKPVVVATYHIGGSADELFEALRIAIRGVLNGSGVGDLD